MTPETLKFSKGITWLVTVLFGTLLGLCFGFGFAYFLKRLSIDYLVVGVEYVNWGTRFGLLSGTAIAAVQTISQKQAPFLLRPFASLIVVFALMTVSILAFAGLGRFLYQSEIWQPQHWRLVNPTRHAMFTAVLHAKHYCPLPSIFLGALAGLKQFR